MRFSNSKNMLPDNEGVAQSKSGSQYPLVKTIPYIEDEITEKKKIIYNHILRS